jgi:membrane glycosyltransferase
MDTVTLAPPDLAAAGFLPDEAPLPMPVQSLDRSPAMAPGLPPTTPRLLAARRAVVILGAVAITVAGGHEMYRVLDVGGLTLMEGVILILYIALFGWIALAFCSAVAGFLAMLSGGGLGLGIATDGPLPALASRTALLMPTYNEPPGRVAAGLQAIAESLAATGQAGSFDLFLLSDTTDPDIWIAEEAAFLALRATLPADAPRLFYRRRPKNTERKAGNIGEWVRRFGAAYPHMLVLDADSVMAGEAIVRLAAAMETHPGVGLIQTLPVIAGGVTLFARMQQFAGRVYGPLIAQGIAWWHGSEGNYWGHNAIIRTAAFAAHAGLPVLRGRAPFGGHVLSHDFVEAALLRRAGWAVHMVPALAGSYEESPPSLTDLAVRDRRWCQGNLQHATVLPARGLHWVSRLHMLMGIGSYVTAPMWLAFLLAGIAVSLQARLIPPSYFPLGRTLFPIWPAIDPVRSMYVFLATMGLLLAPKVLAFLVLLTRTGERRGCGGALRAFCSLLIETLLAGLIAPVAMLLQSGAVVSILSGRDAGWNPQRRDDGLIPIADIVRRYWRCTASGVVIGVGAWLVQPSLAWWMSPVILGLALAVPLAAMTGAPGPGKALRRLGLLRIPEEVLPPPVLARARALQAAARGETVGEAVARLARDPVLLEAHTRMLPPPRRRGAGAIDAALVMARAKIQDASTLQDALAALSRAEKAAALGDAALLEELLALHGTLVEVHEQSRAA